MKKIIGILGVAVIAVAMFFNANNANGSVSDISLASLMNMNVANAQSESSGDAVCLQAQVMVTKSVAQTGKGCYRDQPGPDVLEGNVITCVTVSTGGNDCQPLRCATEIAVHGGCYEQ